MCDIKDDGLTSICPKKIAMIKFIEMFIIAILGASPKVCFRKKIILQVAKDFLQRFQMD